MNAPTIMTPDGQVTIPEDVRDALKLQPGDTLEWTKLADGALLRRSSLKSGRSFEEIEAEIRRIIRYDGPPVSLAEMNDTIARRWEQVAARSDRAGG